MVSSRSMAVAGNLWLCVILLSSISLEGAQNIDKIYPGFQATRMGSIGTSGVFLLSNSSIFGFAFVQASGPTLYSLAVVHFRSNTVVWSANRDNPVTNSDTFDFDENGDAFLQKAGSTVWSTNTSGRGVSAIELQDSGNLVMLGKDSTVVWQSFDHPTDTLLSNQDFTQGMRLMSPGSKNLTYTLEIKSGDMILSAGYITPQPYWSMGKDSRHLKNRNGGQVVLATMVANSWRFYDESRTLLWQFPFSDDSKPNATWIAVLGTDGIISFSSLGSGGMPDYSPEKIPSDACSTPEPCDPYLVCSNSNICRCLPAFNSHPDCGSGLGSPCDHSKASVDLIEAGEGIGYFALAFRSPSLNADLHRCKASCQNNCSCLALFYQNSSGDCYLFDSIGALQSSDQNSGFVSYIKVLTGGGTNGGNSQDNGRSKKRWSYLVLFSVSTFLVGLSLIYAGFRFFKAKPTMPENFLESLSGMPVRFSYKELQEATYNFSRKLGQGGFGTVYQGVLPDGTRLAVKKLEGVGQGNKEFRAEVCSIGSIHHHHLVRLKGFCEEGTHRLLAYEYMAKGSLDKWIFNKDKQSMLDWGTRYKIAIGMAKGLAYLHEDCDMKIVHCDIKPENVLLDDNFCAKVSDFGLAKLMTREQSRFVTTIRGTRGYLAPEWITNHAISEMSDVYSYGKVLFEIIGGRRNYNPEETSEKSYFPLYALKMMEEGKLREILDPGLEIDERDEAVSIAIKVASACIQEDMNLRPSMFKVIQMLEGVCPVPRPLTSSQQGSRFFPSFFKPEDNSDTILAAVQLSGPR
ncbi:G-type lectin S-receptor-like serine/threonine-protein kinase SD2-5 [Syzygium oleosum]|uniref:G-type lectin S-receptor-like serine/threonine-protein kinase SD2-5 n=1 Tax=Syzygium oleosum TaxID=219896 RepID=UPI0024B8E841|nr:G-type lectin S-receptor-like serine/threonine-protein kinase SD2-5 [Syzygium oleosum]